MKTKNANYLLITFMSLFLSLFIGGFDKSTAIFFSALTSGILYTASYLYPYVTNGSLYSVAQGSFTCADLLVVQGKAEELWADNISKRDFMGNVEALKAIRENQTAKIEMISGQQEKDHSLKVIWLQACINDQAAGNECDITGGSELAANCQTLATTITREYKFAVKTSTVRSTIYDYETLVATGFLNGLKELDNYMASQATTAMRTHAGTNQMTGGLAEVSGDISYVAPSYWGVGMIPEFAMAATINQFGPHYLVSGSNLYRDVMIANANAANADGKGTDALFGSERFYFDLFNMDSVLGTKSTFLIANSALAFGSKHYFSTTPLEIGGPQGHTRWSMESKNLPGVFYDAYYQVTCSGNELTHSFKLKANAGIYLNPTGCNADVTGVLEFRCGVPA